MSEETQRRLKGKRILLTGASGVVGQALLETLSAASLICLVRRNAVTAPGARVLQGDVSLPMLGLSKEEYRALASGIDCIVHSAALTNFNRPAEEMRGTNVDGTRRVVALAEEAGVSLVHISTAFVHDRKLPEGLVEFSSYCDSKREAESIVRESTARWAIVRPSIVVGNSVDGSISAFQGIHQVCAALLQGLIPVVPAHGDSYVDFVPQDLVAECVAGLVAHEETGEYWITSGEGALRVGEVLDHLIEFAHARYRPLPRPRLIPPDSVHRLFKPVFLPALPRLMQKKLRMVIDFACYMHTESPFPTSVGPLTERLGLSVAPRQQVLQRNLDYWAAKVNFERNVA